MTPIPGLISILLVNYNGRAHLEECLGSLEAQTFRDFEIVLVDNGSVDGSLDFVRSRFPAVRLVDAGANLGFAGGNNLGLSHCRGEWIFFLNNDTRVEPDALANLARAIAVHPSHRVFAAFMLNYRDPSLVDNAGEVIYANGIMSGFARMPAALFDTPREAVGVCGGAAVFARAVLDEIGGFDDDFFLLFEDVDLSQRARHNGERILFLPDVRIHHKGSATIGGALGRIEVHYTSRNYLPMLVKTFPAVTLLKMTPGILYGLALRLVQVTRNGRFILFARGMLHGMKTLPSALRKRRAIFARSRITRREFERPLRQGWFRERLAIKRGDYRGIP